MILVGRIGDLFKINSKPVIKQFLYLYKKAFAFIVFYIVNTMRIT